MTGRILIIVGIPRHACEQDVNNAGLSPRSPHLIYVGDRHQAYRTMGIAPESAKWCYVGGDGIHSEVFDRLQDRFGERVNLADGIRWVNDQP